MKKQTLIIIIGIALCFLSIGLYVILHSPVKPAIPDTQMNDDMESDNSQLSDNSVTSPADSTYNESDSPPDNGGEGADASTETRSDMNNESELSETTDSTEALNPLSYFTAEPISDSLKARINGLSYKDYCTIPYEDLRYLQVLYVDFNGDTRVGEIICNVAIADDLTEIFRELYDNEYQIDKIRLIDEYNADDDLSCEENNTSCFNYRTVGGTDKLSNHAYGVAIDINPVYNPYVTYPNGTERISPKKSEPYGDRSADFPHKIDHDDLCYKLFIEHGFTWGGDWKSLKDYQHFEKKID